MTRGARAVITLERVHELASRLAIRKTVCEPARRRHESKGSTCAFAESILRAAGLKTGLYTSPHLQTCASASKSRTR